jgi:hypothetical protein
LGQALLAHACNPSYSGGRDQEATQANSSPRPYLKKALHKKGLEELLKVGLEFKSQYCKKKSFGHTFQFYSMDPLILLMPKLPLRWPVGALSTMDLCPFDMSLFF